MSKLTSFLARLEAAQIAYSISHQREEAILVAVAMPGEHWEVEFLGNGSVEVERFVSNGEIYDEEMLQELFNRYAEWSDIDEEAAIAELIPQIGYRHYLGNTRRTRHCRGAIDEQ